MSIFNGIVHVHCLSFEAGTQDTTALIRMARTAMSLRKKKRLGLITDLLHIFH